MVYGTYNQLVTGANRNQLTSLGRLTLQVLMNGKSLPKSLSTHGGPYPGFTGYKPRAGEKHAILFLRQKICHLDIYRDSDTFATPRLVAAALDD